ncbi:MAG: UDP-glucose 4-epimerase GalE [Nanoarchaeota archaeon]|nr:UDP-glucose 4-epimerase GalE [Nanoarchaeota archaeon]MBU4242345.1 UDP-glucose 4-epimerase GalE [Nanoarchaeota archaeon]
MKIFITGGAGYIGSHIVWLLKDKHELVVFDSLVKGHKKSLPQDVNFIRGCLSDKKLLDEIFSKNNFDAVIHLAGFIEAGESMIKPEKYFENNIVNGLNLLSIMKKHNVKKIVYASTAAVYGEPKSIPITEDAEKNPTNYYGLSKLIVEQMLDTFKVYGMKSICLRFFNASGAGFEIGEHHNPETHLIPIVLQVALSQRDSIKIFGTDYDTKDGSCIRDYIHVLDIAKAHELALEALEQGKEGKFNLGTNKGYSVKEVIEVARKITNHEIPAIEEARRLGDPAVLVASFDKAKNILGWQPSYSLKEIVQSAWEWHSKNPRGYNG